MQRARKRKLKSPKGNCYLEAGTIVTTENEGTLVHGRVWSVLLNQWIDHAWVEAPIGTLIEDGVGDSVRVKGSIVIDVTIKKGLRLLPKDFYYRISQAQPEAFYSPDEARVQMLKFLHWGPWHKGGPRGIGPEGSDTSTEDRTRKEKQPTRSLGG